MDPRAILRPGGICEWKIPVGSAGPQLTAPLCAPLSIQVVGQMCVDWCF